MPKVTANKIIETIKEDNEPLVSFITPVYNTGEYLDAYVKSLEEQSYKKWELILSDDGSTQELTKEKLKELENHKNIRVIYNEHAGAPHARNEGAKLANGRYYSFFPSDSRINIDSLKRWVGTLEEHKEYDFVYCGYTFTDWIGKVQDIPYIPQEFDPFFLYQYNYIDGSALMKKEVFDNVKWDESIKSLQDWDFWIDAVKRGYKGVAIHESMFTTAHIRTDGLSDDSHKNWLERTDIIKKKHGLPNNQLCITSLGAPFHAMNLCKIVGADFAQFPARKPNHYKTVYSLGFYIGQNPDIQATILGSFKGRKIIHWIGSDILMMMGAPYLQGKQLVESLNKFIDVHLAEFDQTKKELEELGIKNVSVLPLPLTKHYDVKPLPKEFTMAVYMPATNEELYNNGLMDSVAKAMPDIKFKFFGNELRKGTINNVEYMGKIPKDKMDKFIESCSAIMRITIHDGLPLSPCEFIAQGRNVLSNVKMPFWNFVTPNKIKIVEEIRKMQKLGVNTLGSKHYNKLLDKKEYVKKLQKTIKTKLPNANLQ